MKIISKMVSNLIYIAVVLLFIAGSLGLIKISFMIFRWVIYGIWG